MRELEELKMMIELLDVDVNKFYNKGNNAASVRARKLLQDIKAKSQELRMDISKTRKQ